MKIALIQMSGFLEKEKTIEKMIFKVREAAKKDVDIIVLPEMWNCPYGTKFFREYGETKDGRSVAEMSNLAKELGVYIFGGTISEIKKDKIYNTCFIFNRQGERIGEHRKKHLFDVDIKGKMKFKESEVLSSGNKLTVVDTEFGKIGVAVCFDIRFVDDFSYMTKNMGAKMFIVPAAFNATTGPIFWEAIMRGRAIDNQVFIAACAPARDKDAPYAAYGHSCIINPWGEVLEMLELEESIIYMDLDITSVDSARVQIPILNPIEL